MRYSIYLTGVLSAALIGCTHMHSIARSPTPGEIDVLHTATRNRLSMVTLRSGEQLSAFNFQVSSDTALWVNAQQQTVRMTLHAVDRVAVRSNARGAGDGFLLGLLGGASFAVLAVLSSPPGDISPGQALVFVTPVFGVAGGIVGLPLGAAVGAKKLFVFTETGPPSASGR